MEDKKPPSPREAGRSRFLSPIPASPVDCAGTGNVKRPKLRRIMRRLRIGTAGWSYPEGEGAWSGVFYLEGIRGRDELAFYAGFFNAVGVNSTFYPQALPGPRRVPRR